jgi:hypothetical protein
MEEQKVTLEVAIAEVQKWLDFKRISPNRRESLQSMIDNLANAVVDGTIVINDNNQIEHTLVFPLEGETGGIQKLTYKSRLSDADLEPYKRTLKGTDFDSTLKRTILALTGQPLGVINRLDSSTDKGTAESIAVFFV